jgi:ATP-binding cassette, subfamily B, bacterial
MRSNPQSADDAETPTVRLREFWPHIKPFRKELGLALALGLLGSLATMAQPMLVARLVDGFQSGIAPLMVAAVLCLLIGTALMNALQQFLLERSSERLVYSIRRRLVSHILRLPIPVLEHRSRGDLVSRMTSDVTALRDAVTQGVVELLSQALLIVGALSMMAVIDPMLLVIIVGVVATLAVTVVFLSGATRPAAHEQQTQVGRLSAAVERALGSIRTIRATRSTEHETSHSQSIAAAALSAGLRIAKLKALVGSLVGVTVQLILLAVIGVGALRVASGHLTIGQLSAFVMYVALVITPVALLASTVMAINEALGAFARVRSILDMPLEDRQQDSIDQEPPASDDLEFEFDDVSFRYQGSPSDAWALRNTSFGIPRRTVTAFVGPSGAGKTTLFGLMEQFYDPTRGAIRFRGRDIRGLARDTVRKHLAYVEQDAPAIAGTVRQNLLVGHRAASEEDCVEALRQCNLLPAGLPPREFLDQEIGENGILLSGGERQRLTIARALVSRADVLLLDEATSNLDSTNEELLQEAIRQVSQRCTVLVIAHRLATVLDADQILVLDAGTVIAAGTHGELLETCGLYERFVRLQRIESPGG